MYIYQERILWIYISSYSLKEAYIYLNRDLVL
jgi:hypothetical protein